MQKELQHGDLKILNFPGGTERTQFLRNRFLSIGVCYCRDIGAAYKEGLTQRSQKCPVVTATQWLGYIPARAQGVAGLHADCPEPGALEHLLCFCPATLGPRGDLHAGYQHLGLPSTSLEALLFPKYPDSVHQESLCHLPIFLKEKGPIQRLSVIYSNVWRRVLCSVWCAVPSLSDDSRYGDPTDFLPILYILVSLLSSSPIFPFSALRCTRVYPVTVWIR